MATEQPDMDNQQQNIVGRLFFDHPRSLGMSWAGHGIGAVKIGAELIGAGCAAIVHAVVPGLFTETAGKTVTRIYDHIQSRKAGSANPEAWPDYEI
ncbi:MAG TPA: DUF6356 family protein [Sphingomicrobium sp.]|nr:DUF6356 family protein [Sphingomicrobium sp.]